MLIALLLLVFVILPLIFCVWRLAVELASGGSTMDKDDSGWDD